MIRQTMPDGFERAIEFHPAFDFREDPDPDKRGRGAHSAELHFALIGPMGAVALHVFTGWAYKFDQHDRHPELDIRQILTMAAGVYIHKRPVGDAEEIKECQWLGQCVGGPMSFSGGDEPYKILVQQGEEALWSELRQWYDREFLTH